MMTLIKRYEALCNPVWNIQIIKEYCGCGTNKASEIRQAAIRNHDGAIELLKDCVKADSVLAVLKTTREREQKLLSHTMRDIGRLTPGGNL